jgi:hypothetical protein
MYQIISKRLYILLLQAEGGIKVIIVGRHINGITLNDLEYLLDYKGNIMEFESEEDAKKFLVNAGCTEDEMYYFVFEENESEVGE